jgi:hypothetical protein
MPLKTLLNRPARQHEPEVRNLATQPLTEPPKETARERFKRIGASRMNRALETIRLLGNLSHPQYESTPKDVEDMKEALIQEIAAAFGQFDKSNGKAKTEYVFTEDRVEDWEKAAS